PVDDPRHSYYPLVALLVPIHPIYTLFPYTTLFRSPGQVTIVPGSSGTVTIGVSSGGNRIGEVSYEIIPVPAPTIRAFDARGEIDLQNPYPAPGPSQLLVKAVPEPSFAKTMAKDANFEVTSGEVRLIRNDVPRETV